MLRRPRAGSDLHTSHAPETRAIFRKLIRNQLTANAQELNGTIEGRIGLVMNGGVVPCASATVHLLLKPLDFDGIKQKAAQKGEFNPMLAHMVLEYVIASPDTQGRIAYAKTRTDGRGQFFFPNLPADRWYYVTAQALTGPVMASWQLAVYLYPKERVQVLLTNTNAALPIYAKAEAALER